MIPVPVYNSDGQQIGSVEVDEAVFGRVVRRRLLWEAVRMYEAAARSGTHHTRRRAEVAGGGAKPWRQKGTGRARAGTRSSPLWRGGGVVFGPKPRDYSYAMPKKARVNALRSAYLSKWRDSEAAILDEWKLEQPRTREVAALLKNLQISETCLIVTKDQDEATYLSARNLPGVQVKPEREVNAYDVLRHQRLLLLRDAYEQLVARFAAKSASPSEKETTPVSPAEEGAG